MLGLRGNFTRQESLDKPVSRVLGSPTVQPKCSGSVSSHILKPLILISLLYTDRRNSVNDIFCKVLTRKRKERKEIAFSKHGNVKRSTFVALLLIVEPVL